MTKSRFAITAFSIVIVILATSSLASAQATRTWVSGVGDDANPCSRTAPCKTFAGAISKTAVGGEIDALDPGGFGAVTITKSITIDGCCMASILASGVNAIIVNVGVSASDPERRVTIRHLSINGTGSPSLGVGARTGLVGIKFLAGNALHIENCYIQNFTQEGVNASLTESGAYMAVKDTNITNCATGVSVTTSTGFVTATLEKVRIEKMTSNGLNIGTHGHAHVRDSVIVSNGGDGISMAGGVTDGSVNVESTIVNSNGTGIRNGGTGSVIDISNTSIMSNGTGIASSSGAAGGGVNSHGNNMISGNGAPGTTPNGVGQQ
jgi:hypothetical protein